MAAAAVDTMQVTVPAGIGPGDSFTIPHPAKPDAAFEVVVPDGKKSGDQFRCRFPK